MSSSADLARATATKIRVSSRAVIATQRRSDPIHQIHERVRWTNLQSQIAERKKARKNAKQYNSYIT
jgi:NADP-dependent 3-hydroxy acid dehydrogenase YdfG